MTDLEFVGQNDLIWHPCSNKHNSVIVFSFGAGLSIGLLVFEYASVSISPQQNGWQMDEDLGKTDTTGNKNYNQPLIGVLHCRENRKFGSNYFIRSPPVKIIATLVDSVSLDWELLHLRWIPCFCHLEIMWKSWVEDLVRNHSSQKHQRTPWKK